MKSMNEYRHKHTVLPTDSHPRGLIVTPFPSFHMSLLLLLLLSLPGLPACTKVKRKEKGTSTEAKRIATVKSKAIRQQHLQRENR